MFRLLFASSTVSNVGDGVLLAAVPLLARRLSDDPVAVSAVTMAATLPWLLFALLAGALVDRHDRRRLLVGAAAARAVLPAALAVAVAVDAATLPLVAAAVFALATGEALFDTAAQAVVPAVVAHDRLEAANGRLFGAQLVANSFVGPPVGAALFGAAAAVPFVAAAAGFGTAAALASGVRVESRPRPRGKVRAEIGEGLAWLWRDAGVRAFAVGAAVVNVAHTAAMAVVVLVVGDDIGWTLAAAAVGGVVGTQSAAGLVARLGRRVAVLGAIAGFGAGLAVAGALHVAAGLALFAAAGEVWNVVAVSYRQARVPEHLLGRVMAGYRFIAYGAMPVGAALGGGVAKVFGLRAPFFLGAALAAGLFAYAAARVEPHA